jgi:hypothetical protein
MAALGTKLASAVLLGIVTSAIPSGNAAAEPTSADRSLATELFKEGRALLEQGRVPDACRKLAESQRLDPGGGTLLNLALCHEQQGLTATAWSELNEALGVAKRDRREQRVALAESHIAALEPQLSRLVITVPLIADEPGIEVKRDGSVVGRAAWGSPMPVDPGEHVVEVTAPGKQAWRSTITVKADADSQSITVPELVAAPHAAPQPAPLAAPIPLPVAAPASRDSSLGARPNIAAWTATGIGVIGAGLGTYFGLTALSKKHDSDGLCPTDDTCRPGGADLANKAGKNADLATVSFVVGGVGFGLGAVLFIAQGSGGKPPTSVEVGVGGVRVRGAF